MTSTQYTMRINLDQYTLGQLANGWNMHIYKGAKGPKGALPTLWCALGTQDFGQQVKIDWTVEYGGFFSKMKLEPGSIVTTQSSDDMNPGDQLQLQDDGAIKHTTDGVANAFTFSSLKQDPGWISGLMCKVKNEMSPICAFDQYGAAINVVEPFERILILFTQNQVNTGCVVKTAVSASLSATFSPSLIDQTASFDMNKGWETNGLPSLEKHDINVDLAPILILPRG